MDEHQTTEPHDEQPPKRGKGFLLVAAGMLAVCLGAAGVVWFVAFRPRVPEETTVADAGVELPDAGPSVSLDEGEALLRQLAASWSKHADFATWLSTKDLLRQLVAAVNLVADGESPRPVLTFVSISGNFEVVEKEGPTPKQKAKKKGKKVKLAPRPRGPLFIDPKSYQRYDALTAVFTSVDGTAAGNAYGKLRPYFDAAYAEIGRPGTRFDDALGKALEQLLGVQCPEGALEVVEQGAVYAYKDPAFEALSPAQKQLLRLGSANARRVQETLRAFSEASGIGRKK